MASIKKLFYLTLLLLLSMPALAQAEGDIDSTSVQQYYDSSTVEVRHLNQATIDELKSDDELTYSTDRATVSLWTRFWRALRQLLAELFYRTSSGDVGKLVIYVLAVILLVYAVIALMKLDAVKIFFSGKSPQPLDHTIMEENIHEMDFDKLLHDALTQKDFRLAIRLYFLQGLKMLSDKQMIHWEPGKTNHDYLNELQTSELKKDFRELNYYFEYTWYGYFELTPDLFNRIKEKFAAWKNKTLNR